MDLSSLDVAGLKQLNMDIEKEIIGRQRQEVVRAKEKINAIAKTLGLPLGVILGDALLPKTKVATPFKYRNPQDVSQGWSGRGRPPEWASKLRGAGTLEQARV